MCFNSTAIVYYVILHISDKHVSQYNISVNIVLCVEAICWGALLFLCEVCMISLCLRGFSGFLSAKTCRLG